MLKNTSETEMLICSDSKVYMDIRNGDIGGLENISLPNGKGSSKIKPFDRMVKRKAFSGIIPCVNPKESIYFYYQLNGHWL